MRDFGALHRVIAERSAMPFGWGSEANDCVSFAAAAVTALTGRTINFGSEWTSERGARRVLKRSGGLEAAVDAHLTRIPVGFAQRGDVAGIEGEHGLQLGIVEGDTIVGPGPAGAMRLSRTAAVITWSAD